MTPLSPLLRTSSYPSAPPPTSPHSYSFHNINFLFFFIIVFVNAMKQSRTFGVSGSAWETTGFTYNR